MHDDPPPPRRLAALAGLFGALATLPAPGGATPMPDSSPADGQPPAAAPRLGREALPPCDGRLALVMLTVRDAAGAPVTGARLTTRRVGARAPFPVQPQEHGAGEYQLLDDSALRHFRGGDQPLAVTVAHGGRRRTVRQVVGTTAGGCHVVRRAGAEVVTLR